MSGVLYTRPGGVHLVSDEKHSEATMTEIPESKKEAAGAPDLSMLSFADPTP
jgi:hypothetical protein